MPDGKSKCQKKCINLCSAEMYCVKKIVEQEKLN